MATPLGCVLLPGRSYALLHSLVSLLPVSGPGEFSPKMWLIHHFTFEAKRMNGTSLGVKLLGYRVSEVDEWLGDETSLSGRATLLGFCTVTTQSLSHPDVLVL